MNSGNLSGQNLLWKDIYLQEVELERLEMLLEVI